MSDGNQAKSCARQPKPNATHTMRPKPLWKREAEAELGVEPKDLGGNIRTDVDSALVEHGRQIRSGYSRGYSEGFNDGCSAGTKHAAQTQEFIYDALGLKS